MTQTNLVRYKNNTNPKQHTNMNANDMQSIEGRQLFTPAEYPSDKPLIDHPYSKWLINLYRTEGVRGKKDYELYCDWLESIGYDKEKHMVSDKALTTLGYCHEQIHIHWRRIVNRHTFAELFEIIPTPKDANVIRSKDFYTRKFPLRRDGEWIWIRFTDRMSAIVDSATFIFRVCPKNLYLSIDDRGVVSLRYQTIIGSRLLATITDAE